MARRIDFSNDARRDLRSIAENGLIDYGQPATVRYIEKLEAAFRLIASYPEAGHLHSELSLPIRTLVAKAHVIAYTVGTNHVLIVRLLAGRRDWMSILAAQADLPLN